MKQLSFKQYKRNSLRIAKQLCFDTGTINLIENAKENREIYHLMIQGRLNLPN